MDATQLLSNQLDSDRFDTDGLADILLVHQPHGGAQPTGSVRALPAVQAWQAEQPMATVTNDRPGLVD